MTPLLVALILAVCGDDLACHINDARTQAGLGPLAISDALMHAAQYQADENADRGRIDHVNAHGTTLTDRTRFYGYASWRVGEVLAVTDGTTADAVQGLLTSEKHRAIILDSQYTEMGIGVADRGDWTFYAIVVGGAP